MKKPWEGKFKHEKSTKSKTLQSQRVYNLLFLSLWLFFKKKLLGFFPFFCSQVNKQNRQLISHLFQQSHNSKLLFCLLQQLQEVKSYYLVNLVGLFNNSFISKTMFFFKHNRLLLRLASFSLTINNFPSILAEFFVPRCLKKVTYTNIDMLNPHDRNYRSNFKTIVTFFITRVQNLMLVFKTYIRTLP